MGREHGLGPGEGENSLRSHPCEAQLAELSLCQRVLVHQQDQALRWGKKKPPQ